MLYLWLKVLHQFSFMAWFAGLWYLPRLFVYSAESNEEAVFQRLAIMMWRLFHYIMNPALFFVLFSGMSIVYMNPAGYLSAGWFHIKMTALLGLIIFHGRCYMHLIHFQTATNTFSGPYFRFINEVPTVLLLVILSMAVIKPF